MPLVTGGDLRPVAPFGTDAALRVAAQGAALGLDSEVLIERRAVVRRLWPLDSIRPLTQGDWLLLVAFNDLIQASNPSLPGFWRKRPLRLLDMVEASVERAGTPRTLADALERHATFARVLEITRPDTHVEWWTGSAVFRGSKPPARLLAWPSLRRVRTSVDRVRLVHLTGGLDAVEARFRSVLSRFLASTPLTDLATLDREEPAFEWTGASLGVVQSVHGRNVAERALRLRGGVAVAAREVVRATQALVIDPSREDPDALVAYCGADEFARGLAATSADRSYSASTSRRAAGP